MGGPWEKYQKAAEPSAQAEPEGSESVGPWSKYQEAAPKRAEPEQKKGERVYAAPVGPPVAAIGSLSEIPSRAMASKEDLYPSGTSPERHPVTGTPPVVIPVGAAPRLAKALTTLSEGQGLGFAAGRTALATGQGAAMSALDGKEGESWQDKVDRAKSGATLSGGIQLAAESIPIVGKIAGYAGRKIGSLASGVDESVIKNYAARTDEVNDLIKQSGGDITVAADQVRTELASGIQGAKSKLNAQISETLKKASPDANVSVAPLIKRLEDAKAKLNPNFKASAISEIDEMIAAIKKEAPEGAVNVTSLYQIKQYLNEGSASAYNKGGQIFTRAGESARAAKDAAGEAREALKPVAGAISEADSQLSKLHAIERRLNKNLLTAGKPDAALIAAGSGANPRNASTLRELEKISGVPVIQRAKDLAAAKAFANPSLAPADWTGKAASRVLTLGGIGTAVAGPLGGAAGAALASPMAVKLGVNGVRIAERMASRVPSFGKMIRENPIAAQTVVQLMSKQIRHENPAPAKPVNITPEVEGLFRDNPILLQDVRDPKVRAQLESKANPKGADKWAQSGLKKLGIQDPSTAQKLMQSKRGKQLLIEASDLSPGSRAFDQIQKQINELKGQPNGNDSLTGTEEDLLRHERKPARRR